MIMREINNRKLLLPVDSMDLFARFAALDVLIVTGIKVKDDGIAGLLCTSYGQHQADGGEEDLA